MMYPWEVKNAAHEGGQDSETKMLNKINGLGLNLKCCLPIIPTMIAIYNESGTNARIRGHRRYSQYFAPKEGFRYYQLFNYGEMEEQFKDKNIPVGIEEVCQTVGWKAPLHPNGNWIKINANEANEESYVELDRINDVESSHWVEVDNA